MHAQNRNTAASSPGGRGPPAASSGCTGVPAAGAAAAAAAARILSQGRQDSGLKPGLPGLSIHPVVCPPLRQH